MSERAREIALHISGDERLLIFPAHKDRFVVIDHQDLTDGADSEREDSWVTDHDAGICVPRHHLDSLIQSLQDIRAGLDAPPLAGDTKEGATDR